MSATALGLVVVALLVIETLVLARYVRRQATPADLAITAEDVARASADAADFMSGLTRKQRLEVGRAVVKGRAVADPALATAATSQAYALGLKWRVSIGRPSWIGALAPALWGWLAARSLITDYYWLWRVFDVVLLVAAPWLVHATVMGPLQRGRRAQRAVQLNLTLVARGSTSADPTA